MIVRLIAADDDGRVLAEGGYDGRWQTDVECFTNAEIATLDVWRAGTARWLFAYWPSGAPMGAAQLHREIAAKVADTVVLSPGELDDGDDADLAGWGADTDRPGRLNGLAP